MKLFLSILTILIVFSNDKKIIENDYLKAHALYEITAFAEWPDNNSSLFEIAVLGNKKFSEKATEYLERNNVGSKKIIVNNYESIDKNSQPCIIFICDLNERKLKQTIKEFGKKPVLIISDIPKAAEFGAHITFILKDKKLRIVINEEAVKISPIKINHLLYNVSEIVGGDSDG